MTRPMILLAQDRLLGQNSRCPSFASKIRLVSIPYRRYGGTVRGALGDLVPKPTLYEDVCHFDQIWASAVARGNSQSAEGPAVNVPLSL